jgi:hypothetical protein
MLVSTAPVNAGLAVGTVGCLFPILIYIKAYGSISILSRLDKVLQIKQKMVMVREVVKGKMVMIREVVNSGSQGNGRNDIG